MAFKMPKYAKFYFKQIDNQSEDYAKFKTLFDKYYLCLMLGLYKRELGTEEEIVKEVFVNNFIEDYKDKANIIIGLLIDAELERKGIILEERKSVEKVILDLIDENSITKLNSNAIDQLNKYAAGGMSIIREEIPVTADIELFLSRYYYLLNEEYDEQSY